jgi:hypothetical protein
VAPPKATIRQSHLAKSTALVLNVEVYGECAQIGNGSNLNIRFGRGHLRNGYLKPDSGTVSRLAPHHPEDYSNHPGERYTLERKKAFPLVLRGRKQGCTALSQLPTSPQSVSLTVFPPSRGPGASL